MKILIFSGTTEGRQLSEMLSEKGIFHHVCVATRYGSDVMEKNDFLCLHTGRLDVSGMTALLAENGFGSGDVIVDATHPYAADVSDNIKHAIGEYTFIRVMREMVSDNEIYVNQNRSSGIICHESVSEFAKTADSLSGNILLTTGSKELAAYCECVSPDTIKRTYVRILPALESLEICEDLGFDRQNVIAMHGPFGYEMNKAVMCQYGIRHIVTKDSGTTGGFEEKIRAAEDLGIKVHVISRPGTAVDEGVSVAEAYTLITGDKYRPVRRIVLAGIGPGSPCAMTQEVKSAILGADAVFAASRMIGTAQSLLEENGKHAAMYPMYLADDIIDVLDNGVNITQPVILFSGDSGFCSGAGKVYDALKEWDKDADIAVLPGISSVSYLASKIPVSYEDAKIVSLHGKNGLHNKESLVDDIAHNSKVFSILSGDGDLRSVARMLKDKGVDADVIAGCDLSYENEKIVHMSNEEACEFRHSGLISVLFIRNGLEDSMKTRGKKAGGEEIRTENAESPRKAENRVMVAAASSGSGKTVITCALLNILKEKGLDPISFKCGPDYIDPMFHRQVLGIDSGNLDTFLAGADGIEPIVSKAQTDGHFAVIEGVMGIYDGMSPGSLTGSCYEIAQMTKTPVILVVNAAGIGGTVISLVKGILSDDCDHLIRWIILNRMSESFYERLLPHLQSELDKTRPDVTVLGYIRYCGDTGIDSRHLGLKLPGEIKDLNERIAGFASVMQEGCDLEPIMGKIHNKMDCGSKIRNEESPLKDSENENSAVQENSSTPAKSSTLTVAVARDEAFCFYYPENLALLESLGGRLVYFSPVHDKNIPEGADMLLFGGGYPELYLEELSANKTMLDSIWDAINLGMPSLAECGGFMYLHDEIEDKSGNSYKMAGVINGRCRYTGHLVNFGYTTIESVTGGLQNALVGIRGHEFHYYDSSAVCEDAILCKPSTGKQYKGMIIRNGCIWGWPHFYYPSVPEALKVFIAAALNKHER